MKTMFHQAQEVRGDGQLTLFLWTITQSIAGRHRHDAANAGFVVATLGSTLTAAHFCVETLLALVALASTTLCCVSTVA